MTKQIPLTKGKVALVDDRDFDYLSQWKWQANRDYKGKWYAARTVDKHLVFMHRLITDAPRGALVDHVNGNGLDNRRDNLRICSSEENARNRSINKRHPTGYKGVTIDRKKYRARIRYNYDFINIGQYSTPEEAARAYDRKARELYGEFARLNFPE